MILTCVRVRVRVHVWCSKHYREYLVSLINGHSLDPALLYDKDELVRACQRYQVEHQQADNEDDNACRERLLKVRRRPEQTAASSGCLSAGRNSVSVLIEPRFLGAKAEMT